MARFIAKDATVFTLDSVAMIGTLEEATVEFTVGDEDSAAVNEINEFASPVSRSCRITGSMFVDTGGAKLAVIAAGSDPVVTTTWTTGANSYTGDFLVTTASHMVRKKSLQKQQFTLKSQGAITVTAPT
jgi:hypothetical protein